MEYENLMEEMKAKYYPYASQSRNLTETLEKIKTAMERGDSHIELWTYWTDLPDDWTVECETLQQLKEQGFRVIKRYCDKDTEYEHYWFIVAWDDFEEWAGDENYYQ